LKNQDQSQRVWRWGAALVVLVTAVLPALAVAHKSEAWARSQYETAEKTRTALNEHAAGDRSRHDYQKVIDAYRRVYYGAPSSSKADPSVAAEADLMVEMGRRFGDETTLGKAIRQYEFLRREYPGSKARVDALFAIGEIYRNDLGDPAHAKSTFEELVQRYPRHRLAEQARQALAEEQSPVAKGKEKETASQEAQKSASPGKDSGKIDDTQEARQSASPKLQTPPVVSGIRHWSMSGYTRVAIDLKTTDLQLADLQQSVKFHSQHLTQPDRIYFDLADTKLSRGLNGKSFDVDDPFLKKIRVAQFKQGRTRVVLEVEEQSVYDASLAENPPRLIINIRKETGETNSAKGKFAGARAETKMPSGQDLPVTTAAVEPPQAFVGPVAAPPDTAPAPVRSASTSSVKRTIVEAAEDDDVTATSPEIKVSGKSPVTSAVERSQIRAARNIHEAQPTANGDRSLIRALGLKIGKIVIDPGHGGHDTGTIGPNGLTEKDLVLDVSQRLGKMLESRLGAEVDYTRDDDTFIPLETRTAIANQDQADLFVSVHANSSHDPDARGVETYYLNFTTSRDALDVAARENAVSDQSIYELQDLVKKIALKEKIEESREFASDVQNALHNGLAAKNPGLRDRGVKRAPFIVLIGANMPSILVEISFVSNPGDERKLKTPEYRQRIAESLYRGIATYISGLSGVRVASKMEKSSGQ